MKTQTKTRRRPRQLEEQLQMALVNHLRLRARQGVFWCAIPNGGHRIKAVAAKLKAAGVRAGVPDMLFVVDGRALFMELKTKTGRISNSQLGIGQEILAAYGVWVVAFGIDEALDQLEAWGVLERANTS